MSVVPSQAAVAAALVGLFPAHRAGLHAVAAMSDLERYTEEDLDQLRAHYHAELDKKDAEIGRLETALQKIIDLAAFFDPLLDNGYGHALLIARQALEGK